MNYSDGINHSEDTLSYATISNAMFKRSIVKLNREIEDLRAENFKLDMLIKSYDLMKFSSIKIMHAAGGR